MPNCYDGATVLCPFFKTSSGKQILCEGIKNANGTLLIFSSESNRKRYMADICKTNYKECDIKKAINKKYDFSG